MKKYAFSIYDSKAQTFNPPIFATTKGEAIRSLMDEVNNPSSMLSRHAADFGLYEIGSFDTETGMFGDSKVPELIAEAAQYKDGTN